ncbi:MAG: response regulator transcription factor [Desulfobacterales bacterium]
MAKEKILVVDDEEDILELVRYNLSREGYRVTGTLTGEDALRKVRSDAFDLIILDLMLPGMDGLAFTKTLKNDSRLRSIPIIMLTAKGEESDIVAGLELGADDYITKPFSPKVMIARVRAVLRRHKEEPQDEMAIVKTEFQVLLLLAKRPGWVFTRSQIVDLIRGNDYPVTDRSVDVQIVGLRKKLGVFGKYIETVRGVGYRFKETP